MTFIFIHINAHNRTPSIPLLDMTKKIIRIISRWISSMMILTSKIQFQYFYWAKMLSFSSIPYAAIIITFNPISLIWPNRIMIMQSYKILNVQFLIFIDNKHFALHIMYVLYICACWIHFLFQSWIFNHHYHMSAIHIWMRIDMKPSRLCATFWDIVWVNICAVWWDRDL